MPLLKPRPVMPRTMQPPPLAHLAISRGMPCVATYRRGVLSVHPQLPAYLLPPVHSLSYSNSNALLIPHQHPRHSHSHCHLDNARRVLSLPTGSPPRPTRRCALPQCPRPCRPLPPLVAVLMPHRHALAFLDTSVDTTTQATTSTTAAAAAAAVDTVSNVASFIPAMSDTMLTGGTLALVLLWLSLWQRLTSMGIVTSSVTRKVIHMTCGPSFVLLWPLYTDSMPARLLAASVPLLFATLLIASGKSTKRDAPRAALGRTVSRGGDPREALQGPLYYTFVLLVLTLLLFKTAAASIALAQLCLGDAMAEIVGKRWGASSQWLLPWHSDRKSVAGSTAFVVAAWGGSALGVQWMHYWMYTSLSVQDAHVLAGLGVISIACAAAELAPRALVGDDNVTIAALAVTLSFALFGNRVL